MRGFPDAFCFRGGDETRLLKAEGRLLNDRCGPQSGSWKRITRRVSGMWRLPDAVDRVGVENGLARRYI